MKKFQIDFKELGQSVIPDSRIPLKGNESRLIRVAFDLYRFKEGNVEELWQIQSSDDGEFLVRTYDLPEEEEKKAEYKWMVELDKKGENLTIAYRNIPLSKIAVQKYGINTPEEVQTFQRAIYSKLNTDEDFTYGFVNKLSSAKQELLKEAGFVSNVEINPVLSAIEEKLSKKAAGPEVQVSGDTYKEFLNSKQAYESTLKKIINILRNIRSSKDDKYLKLLSKIFYNRPNERQPGLLLIGNHLESLMQKLQNVQNWVFRKDLTTPQLEKMISSINSANEQLWNGYQKIFGKHPLWTK